MAMYPENPPRASSRYSRSTSRQLFFPRRLGPVLDRGKGDEYAMVSPKMPGGGAVSQAILDDAPHGGGDHAVGVMAVGHGQIQHVGVEVMIAAPAIVLGIGYLQITRPAANGIPQIMQRALNSPQSRGAVAAEGTTPSSKVARALDDHRLGKILNANDTFRGVGPVDSRGDGASLLGPPSVSAIARSNMKICL